MIVLTRIKSNSSNHSIEEIYEKINRNSHKNEYEIVETSADKKRIIIYKNTLNLNFEKKFSHTNSNPYLIIEYSPVENNITCNICFNSLTTLIFILIPIIQLLFLIIVYIKNDYLGQFIISTLLIVTVYSIYKKLKLASDLVSKIEKCLS